MPIHLSHRPTARRAQDRSPHISSNDWHCSRCGALLGIHRDSVMHVSFARGHECLFSYPATATCRRCGTMSQTKGPAR